MLQGLSAGDNVIDNEQGTAFCWSGEDTVSKRLFAADYSEVVKLEPQNR